MSPFATTASRLHRRDFLAMLMSTAGVVSFSPLTDGSSGASYDPGAKFDVKVSEIEFPATQPDAR